jgi:hypothetical protein
MQLSFISKKWKNVYFLPFDQQPNPDPLSCVFGLYHFCSSFHRPFLNYFLSNVNQRSLLFFCFSSVFFNFSLNLIEKGISQLSSPYVRDELQNWSSSDILPNFSFLLKKREMNILPNLVRKWTLLQNCWNVEKPSKQKSRSRWFSPKAST